MPSQKRSLPIFVPGLLFIAIVAVIGIVEQGSGSGERNNIKFFFFNTLLGTFT